MNSLSALVTRRQAESTPRAAPGSEPRSTRVPDAESLALRPESPERARQGEKSPAIVVDRVAIACLLAIPLGVTLRYLPFYLLGPAGRARDPLRPLLDPAGALGLGFGIAGLSLFLFMWLYPLRKHLGALRRRGNLGVWLRVHILAGLTLPFVVAVHAGWRFTGLIGLGYAAMMLVILSGIVGRYLYAHIPRRRNGLELSRDEVVNERRALLTRIAAETGLDPGEVEQSLTLGPARGAGHGLLGTFAHLVADDLARRRALRALQKRWSRPRPGEPAPDRRAVAAALALARRQLALDQQVRMLDATHRVFGWWHVAHLPVAITALLAILVHVTIAVLVGGVLVR